MVALTTFQQRTSALVSLPVYPYYRRAVARLVREISGVDSEDNSRSSLWEREAECCRAGSC